MKREIVKIDRDLCNGCGECIPNCHEGALQMVDGKATLVSDLLCDGLGACIGHCPVGAISIEEREAVPYDEIAALQEMIPHGKNVVIAHLKHLKDHQQNEFLKQAETWLLTNDRNLHFSAIEVLSAIKEKPKAMAFRPAALQSDHAHGHNHGGGCPGSKPQSFARPETSQKCDTALQASELRQWPVQMHLINPNAPYFTNSDLLLAADCVAFAMGNFHQTWLKNKSVAIACPKLDSNTNSYVEKLIHLIDIAKVNTITVMKMQVPCCGGLLQMAKVAMQNAHRKVPIKSVTVGLQGEILQEEWVL